MKFDKIILSFYIQMQKNKCCTFITFLNKLHFCNSKNKKKITKKTLHLNQNSFLNTLFLLQKCNSCTSIRLIVFFIRVPLTTDLDSQRKNNPFDKLQKRFSPSFKNFDISKEKEHYHRSINYKRAFPPPPHLTFLVSKKKTNNITV